MSSEKTTLVEGTKILKMIKKLLRFWIISFQNLKTPQYKEQNPISASITDPVVRVIAKYCTHPSIIAIKENCNSSTPFNFSFVDKEDILEERKSLKSNKATQNTDISTKVIEESGFYFWKSQW